MRVSEDAIVLKNNKSGEYGVYYEKEEALWLPAVYDSPDVKVRDGYSWVLSASRISEMLSGGSLTVVRDARFLPYEPDQTYQPEFIDPVYTGANPNMIAHVLREQALAEQYGMDPVFRLPESEQERLAVRDGMLKALWERFSDVPFDDPGPGHDLVLAEDWGGFEAGTDREEIWHWFDERYSQGGVHSLLFPDVYTIAANLCARCASARDAASLNVDTRADAPDTMER